MAESACALTHPLQLFSSSSSRTFQVEATANKWLKVQVKYVSFLFSAVSAALKVSGCAASGDGGVTCKVKEERITQDTLQIKVSVR